LTLIPVKTLERTSIIEKTQNCSVVGKIVRTINYSLAFNPFYNKRFSVFLSNYVNFYKNHNIKRLHLKFFN
jgi:hypothetical protein